MSNKYKELVENIGLLSISNFATKILTFLLVPLYSRTLTQSEYGTIDIIQTTINLLAPILTLCISEAIIRFTLEKANNDSDILKIGIKTVLRGFIILAPLCIIAVFLGVETIIALLFLGYYLVYTISEVMNQFLKGTDQIKTLVKVSISNILIVITLNIIFLTQLKMGVVGYFSSMIIANLVTIIYSCWKIDLKKHLKNESSNKKLEKEMKKYSIPMIFNSISWWINNASDKYLVLWICGVAQNGIYSMSYKIPTILMVVQNIFIQAWQISAVKEFEKEGKEQFFSLMYDIYNFIMILGSAVLIITTKILAGFLYGQEFYEAWKYVPILLISVIFGALSGFIGTIFSATKNSKIYAKSTIIGAVFNIILNIILIPLIGVMGAAIATALSYFIVWIFRIKKSRQYINLKIDYKRHFILYAIILVQAIVLIMGIKYNIIINIMLTILILIVNKNLIKLIIEKGKNILNRRNK